MLMVANSFDLWQKDTFFPAAEEIQQSADIMESAYRAWLNSRKEVLTPPQSSLDELSRHLQMALGTAKWQLEEFERAVNQSYRINSDDEATITRHKQFVCAIRDQISLVEADLKGFLLNAENKKPFRWVNLDEEECDELANFLSSTPGTSQRTVERKTELREGSRRSSLARAIDNSDHQSSGNYHTRFEGIGFETAGNRRKCNSTEKSALEIIIDNSDSGNEISAAEATPKEKGSKPFFWRLRGENYPGTNIRFNVINWIDHQLRGSQIQQIQKFSSPSSPARSIRLVLVLSLTIFLVVPFLIYST